MKLTFALVAVTVFYAASASAFVGPGPRDDGRIYVADYIAQFGGSQVPCKTSPIIDSTVAINLAESDAGLINTTVMWPPAIIWAANINVPIGVVNVGQGQSYINNCSTVVIGTQHPNSAVFILAQNGPFEFRDMAIKANKAALYSPNPGLSNLTLTNVQMAAGAGGANLFLAGTSDYPINITRCSFSQGAYGIYAANHLGNVDIEDSIFSSQTSYAIALMNTLPNVVRSTSEHIRIVMTQFSEEQVPDVYMEGNVNFIDIDHMETERVTPVLADFVFGQGSIGHLTIDHSIVGVGAQYAIYNAPGETVITNSSLGAPVQTQYPSKVTFGYGCADNCTVVP